MGDIQGMYSGYIRVTLGFRVVDIVLLLAA